MVTTSSDEPVAEESFIEAFPHMAHDALTTAVTGSTKGDLRTAVLSIVVAIALAFAPVPISLVGLAALLMLNVWWLGE